VLYLVSNAGADGPSGGELRTEAIRLTRAVASASCPTGPGCGLLALLLLTKSRQRARFTGDGSLVLLRGRTVDGVDRTLQEGQAIVRACLRRNVPGPYQVQAAISAVHADATSVESTDWNEILALYDQLLALSPTPVVALNRAIALGEVRGPAAALAVVDDLELDGYYLFHATRADLLPPPGRPMGSRLGYARAATSSSDPERTFVLEESVGWQRIGCMD
jgi:RNA polymerase sigma-70 factor (ECF subfamily)